MSIPGPVSPLVLSLRGVSKAFGAVQALRDVSVDCRAGEIHALVGENGSGKSTLLGIASGFVHPDEGAVEIGGQRRAARLSGRGPEARPRHRVPDLLARPRPVGRREPLSRRARGRAAGVRPHGGVGGGESSREFELDVPVDGAARVAVARRAAAPRGRQGAARPAEGPAPRRADDGARARGGRAAPRARARAEPGGRRHRLRQPPAAGGARHRRPRHRPARRRRPGHVRGRRPCRRRASSR